MLSFCSRTARVGNGAGLLPGRVLVKYSKTGLSCLSTSTTRLLLESVIRVCPLSSRLAKATPLVVPWAVKVATIVLGVVCVTSMARLLFSSENENVAIGEQLGGIGVFELIGPVADDTVLAVLPDDGIVRAPNS